MSSSLRIRLEALVKRAALDAQLAEGRNPRTSPQLALRAAQLTERAARRRLSAAFRAALDEARGPISRRGLSPRVPLNRRAVLDCRRELEALADRLAVAEHPRPRGVAIAHLLLVDGAGPLYARSRADQLIHVIHTADRALGSGHPLQ
ncbi:MAG TPA: hypothetical protein VGN78_11600 [Solirubrobacteraceae bacterium]|jgi:hypothetical protein|nr:hypothetical protein [Solirubrobacteraceae bacterium]